MITTQVLTGVFKYLLSMTSDFPVIENIVYGDGYDLNKIVSQYVGTSEKFNKTYGESKQWIFISWTREIIKPHYLNPRKSFNLKSNNIPRTYDYKLGETNLEINFIVSDISLAENLEEFFVLNLPENFSFDLDYVLENETISNVTVNVRFDLQRQFQKLYIENMGSIVQITLNTNVMYPIIGNVKDAKIIEDIELNIYKMPDILLSKTSIKD